MSNNCLIPKASHGFMARALELAAKGLYTTNPNPRVGCVIVNNNQIVGEGFHKIAGEPHAEVYALEQAGNLAVDSDVYVTLEPCSHFGKTPPCANALIKAKVKRVFIASLDPNPLVSGNGIRLLEESGIIVYKKLLNEDALRLNPGFMKRMKTGLPWVRIKLASSLDGRTAMESGESKWITGEQAREDVHKLRARSSAVLTGIGTIKVDNPSMNVRLTDDSLKEPVLVVLDSNGSLNGEERIFSDNKNIIIFTKNNKLKNKLNVLFTLKVIVDTSKKKQIDLNFVLKELAKLEVNEVHVECGSELAGSFVKENLADEVVTYIAPKLMGNDALPMFNIKIGQMVNTKNLKFVSTESIGNDLKITAEVV